MKPILAALLTLALAGCGARAQPVPFYGPIQIDARPVALDEHDLARTSVGGFRYAGGLWLTTKDTDRLGGLSDLKVFPDGRLVSESDEGPLLRAKLRLDAQGRLVGLDDAALTQLADLDGKPLVHKDEADAEGVAVWPNGDLMVSFERDDRIWLYPADASPAHAVPKPPINMPYNQGMEGLTLAPSQGADAYWVGVEGGSIWLCRLSAACVQKTDELRPPLTYRLTALAETPAGDLIVLHHSFNPLTKASRVLVSITRFVPGKRVQVVDQLVLAAPLTLDNFEGIAALPGKDGAVRLYMIADDNFSPDQRTLLLAFDWTPKKP